MKRMLVGMALAMFAGLGCQTAPSSDADRRVQTAEVGATVEKFKAKKAGVDEYFEAAHGYAVFPTIGKGGIGVGGAFGRGQVFEGGQMIGYSKLTSASIGFQLGGQSFSEILFFEDKAALERFKGGGLEFDANASAVAASAGAAAKADFKNGVAVFVMADAGLMYEASVGGQKFAFEAVE